MWTFENDCSMQFAKPVSEVGEVASKSSTSRLLRWTALEFRSLRLPHNAVYNVARHGRFACCRPSDQSPRGSKTHLRDAPTDLKLDRLRAQSTGYRADVSVSCQLSVADDGRVLCTCCISRSSEHGSAQTASGERAPESTRAVLLAPVAGRPRPQLQQPQRCVQK